MLEMSDVTFGYRRDAPLYAGLDLTVAPEERVALSAPSGFGKTTLCLLMAGYLTPWSGTITVEGKSLPRSGRSPVQIIMQHPEQAVDPRKRMAATLEEAGEVDGHLLDAFGIKGSWLSRFPHELSGGELQRFCIVRALMAKPRYLIADEISTMLDAVTQVQLWQALLEELQRRQTGLVVVSHSPALTERLATRVVTLAQGPVCSPEDSDRTL